MNRLASFGGGIADIFGRPGFLGDEPDCVQTQDEIVKKKVGRELRMVRPDRNSNHRSSLDEMKTYSTGTRVAVVDHPEHQGRKGKVVANLVAQRRIKVILDANPDFMLPAIRVALRSQRPPPPYGPS